MTRRLLLVEPSATMRQVLESHVRALGYRVEGTGSYTEALETLQRQYRAFGEDIACVLHGWPTLPDPAADRLARRLESVDFEDLPVIVMSTDMRAATRAWVAGRERTAMLAWRDYAGIDALLEQLLESDVESGPDARIALDDADLRVLVVDDSPTIRQSLRDLLELQGYRVALAATPEEALAAARAARFDIAVLDFYLEHGTGDVLCRELVADPACGDVVCAILTGTYADHVIKRSLRAGAVECMFKNESSEVLLARIDAIGRIVRRRRAIAADLDRLRSAIDAVGTALLVLDEDERVRHASPKALVELGLDAAGPLVGRDARTLLGVERLPPPGGKATAARWRDARGRPVDVGAARTALPGDKGSVLRFASAVGRPAAPPAASSAGPSRVAATGPASRAATVVGALGLPPASVAFVERLESYAAFSGASSGAAAEGDTGAEAGRASLLVLGVFAPREDGTYRGVGDDAGLAARVEHGLRRLYRHEHHVAHLGAHRYGLLLRRAVGPRAYLMTRRLMQLCNELPLATSEARLASTGCLLGLGASPDRDVRATLARALHGLGLVEARGVDRALLLDLRRMLAVYPDAVAPDAGPGSPPPAGA